MSGGIARIRTPVTHRGAFMNPDRTGPAYPPARRPLGRGQAGTAACGSSLRPTGYQHAVVWPGATSASGGISVRHLSGASSGLPLTIAAFGQRGWNGQPHGGSAGDGHVARSG